LPNKTAPIVQIIDYEQVLATMQGLGLRSLYYNSGAFGFPEEVKTQSVGWIGPDDPSLRLEALELAVKVHPPYENELTRQVVEAIRRHLGGDVWVMPMSHWAYELDFGSRDWMPHLLKRVGIDPRSLQSRTNAAAIEFGLEEMGPFSQLVEGLLQNLLGSDFALAFSGRAVACTLHHHKQVWWTSTDDALIASLKSF
jgi:hypothetical protein